MIIVSIVTYKTQGEELSQILKLLVADKMVVSVIIVDNSPTDCLKDVVCCISPKIIYLFGHGNVGYGAAHNIAIRRSIEQGAKYHIVINPDIIISKDTITVLADYMDRNPDVGNVMPKVVYPDGTLQYLCKLLPTPLDLIVRRFIPFKRYVQEMNEIFEMRYTGYDKIMDVPFLSGCFMFLRVETLNKIDGFDDRYFMYCEDTDLCRTIMLAGYRTVYNPNTTIVHVHAKQSYESGKMLRIHIRSAIKYFNKWGWFFDPFRRMVNRKAKVQTYCKNA